MPKSFVKITLVLLAALLVTAGCGKPEASGSGVGGASNASEAQTGKQTEKQLAVKTYYGDDQGMKLVEKTAQITYAKDGDQYLAALNALKKSPEPQLVALCEGVTFKSAALQGKQLTVDLSIAPEGQWGASGEQLTVQAIENTIFQFGNIDSIEILQDGKPAESLMGHMDIPHPIHRTG